MRSRRGLAVGLLLAGAARAAAPTLLADLDRRPAGSYPQCAVTVGTTVFCNATSAAGDALWRADMVTPGAQLVTAIDPTQGGVQRCPLALGQAVLFFADDGEHGDELWTSDGTDAGTQLLGDLYPGPRGTISAATARLGCALGVAKANAGEGERGRWRKMTRGGGSPR